MRFGHEPRISSGGAGLATAFSAGAPTADEICSRFTGNRIPRLNDQEDTRWKCP
jgi:hypothetical protein